MNEGSNALALPQIDESTGYDIDSAIITFFVVVLLSIFSVMVAVLPFGTAGDALYVPTLFGP